MPARSTRARVGRSTRPISIIRNIGDLPRAMWRCRATARRPTCSSPREVASDLKQLARQMARLDERRAASQFFHAGEQPGPVCPLTPMELLARLTGGSHERRYRRDRIRSAFVEAAREELERRGAKDQGRSAIKEKEKSRGGDHVPKTGSRSRPYRQMLNEPRHHKKRGVEAQDDGSELRATTKRSRRMDLLALWRRVAAWMTHFCRPPTRPGRRRDRLAHRLRR